MFEAEFLGATNDVADENEARINQVVTDLERMLLENVSMGHSRATALFDPYLTEAVRQLDFKEELGFLSHDNRVVVGTEVTEGRVTVQIIRVCL